MAEGGDHEGRSGPPALVDAGRQQLVEQLLQLGRSVALAEIHPSPSRAARRSAARVAAHVDRHRLLRCRADHQPVEVVVAAVVLDPLRAPPPAHTARMISMASSVRAPRVRFSVPVHVNSSGIHDEPDAEARSGPRQRRHGGHLLRHQERVADRQLHHVGVGSGSAR